MRAVVTGGTRGIGREVTRQLVQLGWEVVVIGRDQARGNGLAAELGVTFLSADLSLMSDVRRVGADITGPIDALILCAGVVSTRDEVLHTTEGLELTFATNYLGKFVLSQSLLASMSPGGAIVMVGGDGRHAGVPTDWAAQLPGMRAARMASLAVDIYAAELARNAPTLRIHTCYPGPVRTGLLNDSAWPIRAFVRLAGASAQKGSAPITQLALQPHVGVHFTKLRPMTFAPQLPAETDSLLRASRQLAEHT